MALASLIGVSVAVRAFFAWRHATPRYFPDEYIYAALGRSIGHGRLEIRGATTHFPAILEPVLAAPIWRLFSTMTAYHLVQIENAAAASLTAIPIYLLARSLRLSSFYSCVCAAYALVIPSLVLIAFTMSDLVAYLLAISALAVGVRTIDEPTTRRQLAFLALASLATFARVEYFVLVPAYLVGAAVVDRRRVFRTHRVALVAMVPVILIALVAGFGYYSGGVRATRFDAGYVRWFFLQAFLLTLVVGVVIVPGAVAALLRPKDRREVAFATFIGAVTIFLLGEATAHAADSSQFKERYLFMLLPVLPIAFGLYLKHQRPLRPVVIAVAAVIVIAAARLPLSEYATGTFKSDSQFLLAVGYAQDRLGVASASLAVAVLATIGAAGAVAVALRGFPRSAVAATLIVAGVTTAGALTVDLEQTRAVRAGLPGNLTWIDDSAKGLVTAIATPVSLPADLLNALYWNVSVQREVVLGSGIPSDSFSAPSLQIGGRGEMLNARGEILFDDFGTTGSLANAARVARVSNFTLWRPRTRLPRFRLLIEGRFYDEWLSPDGRIRVWPATRERSGTRISFTLSLPRDWRNVAHLKLGETTFTVRPGSHRNVVCRSPSGPLDLRFSSRDVVFNQDFRRFTVKLSRIRLTDGPRRSTAAARPPCTAST